MDEVDEVSIKSWCIGYAIELHKEGVSPELIIRTATRFYNYIMGKSGAENTLKSCFISGCH